MCTQHKGGKSNCGDHCNNSVCKCPASCNISFFNPLFNFSFDGVIALESSLFSSCETPVSKGFVSIWLIPKIG
ncbi:hypothetical protein [Chryseobacterium sp.]|uniref:hypothetical protein n=1 Tax=Chryseobacterium sp. TaxID=1871047 RepID=UPI0025C15A31|nr:hypothetical protein [Chryseobacterium sp.]